MSRKIKKKGEKSPKLTTWGSVEPKKIEFLK